MGIHLIAKNVWLESWFDLEDKLADKVGEIPEEDKTDLRFLLYSDLVIDIRECETSAVEGWDFQYGMSGGTQMLYLRVTPDGDAVAVGIE